MKKRLIIIGLCAAVIVIAAGITGALRHGGKAREHAPAAQRTYYCPMHPTYTSNRPGSCPICGMDLVVKEPENAPGTDKEKAAPADGVYISPEKQQLIGVKTAAVQRRALSRTVRAAASVANDPDLYTAQSEYLRTWQFQLRMQTPATAQQGTTVYNAAKRRLQVLGMSEEEIKDLEECGHPDENLYFPQPGGKTWLYALIHEQDIALVRPGLTVKARCAAWPGVVFTGKVVSVSPVVSPNTRTATARARIDTGERMMKAGMFFETELSVPLGSVLAVPEEAIMRTGERTLVFMAEENGYFQPREVVLGNRAEGYYEVRKGLSPGDQVVTSANFLVDSESRLKAAIGGGQ